MTDPIINLPEAIAKSDDADFLRDLIHDAAQRLMDIEVAYLAIAFLAPILYLMVPAVDNPETRTVLPQTLEALDSWDGKSTPEEAVFSALAVDLKKANSDRTAALVGKRLNHEISGMRRTDQSDGHGRSDDAFGHFHVAVHCACYSFAQTVQITLTA